MRTSRPISHRQPQAVAIAAVMPQIALPAFAAACTAGAFFAILSLALRCLF